MNAAGLILAAGAGTRFGEQTKQLADLRGEPLLQHARRHDERGALERVVVVLGHDADAIRARVDFGDGRGRRLRGLGDRARASRCARGVAALADADAVAITLGDQPFITPQVIAARARCSSRATTPSARSTTARPATRSCSAAR